MPPYHVKGVEELPPGVTPDGNELLPVHQDGSLKHLPISEVQQPTDDVDFNGHALRGLPAPTEDSEPLRVGELARMVDRRGQGREHVGQALRMWHAVRSDPDVRPRVVMVADSMGELSMGWASVWQTIIDIEGGTTTRGWQQPWWAGFPMWGAHDSYAVQAVGIDGRGAAFTDATVGPAWEEAIPTTLDLYYTARPSGGSIDVAVDGDVIGTVNTALDEEGNPVTENVPGQRWRSGVLDTTGLWTLTATGTVWVEAVSVPSEAIEVIGIGRSGQSTAQAHARVIPYVEAMVARGEAPHLVVLAADTAESGASSAPAVAALVDALRALVPTVSICQMIPAGHSNWGASEALQNGNAAPLREVGAAKGLAVVDLLDAMGVVWSGNDPYGWHNPPDYVHHNVRGMAAAGAVFADVLLSRTVETDSRVTAALADAAQALADAAQGIEDAATAQLLAEAANNLAEAALPKVGGEILYTANDRPALRVTAGAGNIANGIAAFGLSSTTHPIFRVTHFFGVPILEFVNATSGVAVSQISASGPSGTLRVNPMLTIPTVASAPPSPPNAGDVTLWWDGTNLKGKTSTGTVITFTHT